MAQTVKELLVKIKAKTEQDKIKKMDDAFIKAVQSVKEYKKETAKTESRVRRLGSALGKLAKQANIGALAKGAAGGIAAIAAAASGGALALFKFGSSFAAVGDELAKQGKRLGVNTTALQKLEFAAELAGTSAGGLNMSLRLMNKGLVQARITGSGPFLEGIEALGLTMSAFEGRTMTERLGILADEFAKVEDRTEASGLAMLIFGGRMGSRMLPLLQQGSAGIREAGEELGTLGAVLEEDVLVLSEEFVDELVRQKAAFQGLKNVIFREAAPALMQIITSTRRYIVANRVLLGQKIAKFIETFTVLVKDAIPQFLELADATLKLIDKVGGLRNAIILAATAWTGLKLAMAGTLNPVAGIILGLVTAIPLAMKLGSHIGDLMTRLETGATRRTKDIGTSRLLKEQQDLAKTAAGRKILSARRTSRAARSRSIDAFAQLSGETDREIVRDREISNTQLEARRDFADTVVTNMTFREQRLQGLHRKQLAIFDNQEKNQEEEAKQTRQAKQQLELARLSKKDRRTVIEDIRVEELRDALKIGADLKSIARKATKTAEPTVEELIKSVVTTQGGITALRNPSLGTNIFNVNASATFDQDIVVTIPTLPEGSNMEDLKKAIGEALQDVNRVAFEHQKSVIVA